MHCYNYTLIGTVEDDIDVDVECVQLLRENAFVWTMNWAQRVASDIYKCASHAPFAALTSFSRLALSRFIVFMLEAASRTVFLPMDKAAFLLYVGGRHVHHTACCALWDHKSTKAIMAFSNVTSFLITKYGTRCNEPMLALCKLNDL
ncbi:unnamed protein product [Gongylonema pulchrum]|uniref:Dynein light chain n=1 Tax=Gongylonema pulchrum TaxID=637853 RepID=A0A183EPE2_9BILA|nr:unnamed protein product [Gongylonema pulchrum]